MAVYRRPFFTPSDRIRIVHLCGSENVVHACTISDVRGYQNPEKDIKNSGICHPL